MSSWFARVTDRDHGGAPNQQTTGIPNTSRRPPGKWPQASRLVDLPGIATVKSPTVWKSGRPGLPAHRIPRQPDELSATSAYPAGFAIGPYIDGVYSVPNPDDPTGRSRCAMHSRCARRVVQFDPCRMPRCTHPFENLIGLVDTTPATIVEYIGQTRGWLYTPYVLATAFDRSPKPVAEVGLSLALMARDIKSLRNYPDVTEVRSRRTRRHAVVPDGTLISARRQPTVTIAIATVCDKSCCPCGTPTASWRCMHRKSVPGASDSHVLDRYNPGQAGEKGATNSKESMVFTDVSVLVNICWGSPRRWTNGMCDGRVRGSGQKTPMPSTRHTVLEVTTRLAALAFPSR